MRCARVGREDDRMARTDRRWRCSDGGGCCTRLKAQRLVEMQASERVVEREHRGHVVVVGGQTLDRGSTGRCAAERDRRRRRRRAGRVLGCPAGARLVLVRATWPEVAGGEAGRTLACVVRGGAGRLAAGARPAAGLDPTARALAAAADRGSGRQGLGRIGAAQGRVADGERANDVEGAVEREASDSEGAGGVDEVALGCVGEVSEDLVAVRSVAERLAKGLNGELNRHRHAGVQDGHVRLVEGRDVVLEGLARRPGDEAERGHGREAGSDGHGVLEAQPGPHGGCGRLGRVGHDELDVVLDAGSEDALHGRIVAGAQACVHGRDRLSIGSVGLVGRIDRRRRSGRRGGGLDE